MKPCHLFSSVGCQCHLHKGAVRIQTHARALRLRWRELAADEFDRIDEQSVALGISVVDHPSFPDVMRRLNPPEAIA